VQRIIRAYDEHKVRMAEQMELLDAKIPPNGSDQTSGDGGNAPAETVE
jgi:hypothetical protein